MNTAVNEVDATENPMAAEEEGKAPPPSLDTHPEDSHPASSQVSLRPLSFQRHPDRTRDPQAAPSPRPLGQYPRVTFSYRHGLPATRRQPLRRDYGVVPRPAPHGLYSPYRFSRPHLPFVSDRAVPFRGSVRPDGASSRFPDAPTPSVPQPLPHFHPFTPSSLEPRPITPNTVLVPPSPMLSPVTFPPPLLVPRPVTPTTPDDSFLSQVDVRAAGVFPSDLLPQDPTGPVGDPASHVDNINDLHAPTTDPRNLFYDPRNFVRPNVDLTDIVDLRVALPDQDSGIFLAPDMRPSGSSVSRSFVNQNRPCSANTKVVRSRIVNPPPFVTHEPKSHGVTRTFVDRGDNFVNPLTTPIVDRDGNVINQGVPSLANYYTHFTDREESFENPAPQGCVNAGDPFVNQDVQALDNRPPFVDHDTVFASHGVRYPITHPAAAHRIPPQDLSAVLVSRPFPRYAPYPVPSGGHYGYYYRRSPNYGGY
ncbi:uncharacterized protein LOC123509730 [Portunus trituberculatus]|uniref:uncharacterized protein LOC123509730 n=1 Tax=Portunus trituberculatus TaxID=210409 RepID=UPI001E1CEC48|nr:uncharacterized protein LOC123509730 [Portunus trituberculatus]